jgi:hypothetical protein
MKLAASTARWRRWVVTLALVAAFAAVALWRQGAFFAPQPTLPAADIDWQVYHDQLGLFTMRLPPGWTAASSLGSFTEGDRTGSESGQDETVIFSDPALGASSPSISVYAQPITNSVGHAMTCSGHSQETATFNGYPADTSSPALILFESGNAHFQIVETIPGALVPDSTGGSMNPPTPPPPPPAATVTAERALLADALASFQPSDAKPLTCS